MKLISMAFAMATALMCMTTQTNANQHLTIKYNCMACHAVDKKVVGPSYKAIAAKYKGDTGAVARLEKKVKNGGVGIWGQVPMPATSNFNEADIKELVKWILRQ